MFAATEFNLTSAGVQSLLAIANSGAEMTTTDPLPDTSINRSFRAISFLCAASQVLLFARHVLWPLYGRDFNVEPFFAVATSLLVQIMGGAFALGAGTKLLSCMITNIACTILCLSLFWFF